MSVHISSAVWKLALDATEKLILLRMADCADHDGGNAWPSVATIAKDCGVSESTVQRCLRSLKAAGYLEIQRVSGQHRPTTYRVVPYAMGVNLTPLSGVSPEGSGVSNEPPRGVMGDTRSVLLIRPSDPSSLLDDRARAKKTAKPRKKKAAMTLDEKMALDAVKELTGTLTSFVKDAIAAELKGHPGRGGWIVMACKVAAEQNVRKWAYVKGVLKHYDNYGLGAPLEGSNGRANGNNGRRPPPSRNGRSNADADREKQRAAAARGGEW